MKLERALEIFDSLGVIDVKYGKHHVWIDDIHKETKTASVMDLETHENMEVPVDKLLEG